MDYWVHISKSVHVCKQRFSSYFKSFVISNRGFWVGIGGQGGGGGVKGADVFHIRHSMFVFNIRYMYLI